MFSLLPVFGAGMVLSLSLIIAIGPQNAHLLRMALARRHVALTVAICLVSDVLLIAFGVLGLAHIGGLSDKLFGALIGAGALFLLWYGGQALRRVLRPALPMQAVLTAQPAVPSTRRQAVLAALAFTWLNPHAWLDTAVLIGTASLAHGSSATLFGAGAAAGSVLWFCAFGAAAVWLGQHLQSPRIWRVIDALVAALMLGSALWLLRGLAA